MTGGGTAVVDPDAAVAEVALRCAWLREHAHRLFNVDPSGQLSAQLWDFADLLEVAQDQGWWS